MGATQPVQVKAIVSHFRKKMADGTFKIMAGPPKPREEHPKVAKGTTKLLSESIEEHLIFLRKQIEA